MPSHGFSLQIIDEQPGVFHARPFDEKRALWVPRLSGEQTLVLGSSQSADTVDEDVLSGAGVALTSRRSGGGAVLVSNDDLVWFDVVLGKDDPLWDDDVVRSFDWLGRVCQQALRDLGVETAVHDARLQSSKWSRLICFAGLGPGELTIDGKKVVGMSQRRTRTAARLQVAILRRWNGPEHARFLNLSNDERAEAANDLTHIATGIPHSPDAILEAIIHNLY